MNQADHGLPCYGVMYDTENKSVFICRDFFSFLMGRAELQQHHRAVPLSPSH